MEGVYNIFSLKENETKNLGIATLRSFSISNEESKVYNLKSLFNGNGGFDCVTAGQYVKLSVNNILMMSDTDMEKRTNYEFISNAKGDVMIAGLGIGLILHNLEKKVKTGEVKSITVYEKYQDVIDLITPYYKHLPITVKCEDILNYLPPKEEI